MVGRNPWAQYKISKKLQKVCDSIKREIKSKVNAVREVEATFNVLVSTIANETWGLGFRV